MFFSDLDRTLIYSSRFLADVNVPLVVVENKDGREISYMTEVAYKALQSLRKKTMFIPVTARKWEEVMRIGFIEDDMPEWMVCEAGRTIYNNGKRYEPWDRLIATLSQVKPEVYERFCLLMQEMGTATRSINEYMLMAKIDDWTEELKKKLENETEWFHIHGCNLLIQGRKVYLLPTSISKSNAVRYLTDLIKPVYTVSSGDADMDYGMFIVTECYIAPKHHTISHNLHTVTGNSGIQAAEDIILFAQKQLCSS